MFLFSTIFSIFLYFFSQNNLKLNNLVREKLFSANSEEIVVKILKRLEFGANHSFRSLASHLSLKRNFSLAIFKMF